MKTVELPTGERIPASAWELAHGRGSRSRRDEVEAVRFALQIGYRLIDTARCTAKAAPRRSSARHGRGAVPRDESSWSARSTAQRGRKAAVAACERSLKRLRSDRIDLYCCTGAARAAGETWRRSSSCARPARSGTGRQQLRRRRPAGTVEVDDGERCAANQSTTRPASAASSSTCCRGSGSIGCRDRLLPIDQGAGGQPALQDVARARQLSAAQVALAWVLRQPDAIAIPKAVQAATCARTWRRIDRAFRRRTGADRRGLPARRASAGWR